MNSWFEIGEIAILRKAGRFPQYSGTECEVIGPLELRWCWRLHKDGSRERVLRFGYQIRVQDGQKFRVPPKCLRKKRPPVEPVGKWENMPWLNVPDREYS